MQQQLLKFSALHQLQLSAIAMQQQQLQFQLSACATLP
jgi:chaperonin cofactor prefoldin